MLSFDSDYYLIVVFWVLTICHRPSRLIEEVGTTVGVGEGLAHVRAFQRSRHGRDGGVTEDVHLEVP